MVFKVKKMTAEMFPSTLFEETRERNSVYRNRSDEEILASFNRILSKTIKKNRHLGFGEGWGINNEV